MNFNKIASALFCVLTVSFSSFAAESTTQNLVVKGTININRPHKRVIIFATLSDECDQSSSEFIAPVDTDGNYTLDINGYRQSLPLFDACFKGGYASGIKIRVGSGEDDGEIISNEGSTVLISGSMLSRNFDLAAFLRAFPINSGAHL
jgi:hypothetical protein